MVQNTYLSSLVYLRGATSMADEPVLAHREECQQKLHFRNFHPIFTPDYFSANTRLGLEENRGMFLIEIMKFSTVIQWFQATIPSLSYTLFWYLTSISETSWKLLGSYVWLDMNHIMLYFWVTYVNCKLLCPVVSLDIEMVKESRHGIIKHRSDVCWMPSVHQSLPQHVF